jgi:hypothetical protein
VVSIGIAGQDPECSFADLGEAVRKIRIDFSIPDCVIRLGVPEPTEWQRIGNQIDGALTNARPGIVIITQNENQETQYEKNHIKPKKIRLERKFET